MEYNYLVYGITFSVLIILLVVLFMNTKKSKKYNETLTALKLSEDRLQNVEKSHEQLAEKMIMKDKELSALQIETAKLESNLGSEINKSNQLSTSLTDEIKESKHRQEQINDMLEQRAEQSADRNNLAKNLTALQEIHEKLTSEMRAATLELKNQTAIISRLETENDSLTEKLQTQKKEIVELQKTAHLEFEKIANEILETKTSRFTETNKKNMETILNPLKEDIVSFKTKVEDVYALESKERFSLGEKVKDLIEQTNKVSKEANNLATALKGQTKKQGNWGEMILERILETSGLTKDREYFVQQTIKDEEGKSLRPDILVKLPDDRVIIIDSKVSLNAYDRFVAAENPEEQKIHFVDHMKSIYGHIDDLSGKKYDNLENSLDFTMMFVAIEPAYMVSIQGDQELWSYAYSKRILLISPTNLIACLRLITDLWKREKQSKNATEIVKRGELMYEKFITFFASVEDVGKNLNKTLTSYEIAVDQLKNGRGNLISQASLLHGLGLKSNKKIPIGMIPMDANESEVLESDNDQNSLTTD